MSVRYADLHIHTTCSDGLVRPEDIASLAKGAGLGTIAITDHDTIKGVGRAVRGDLSSEVEIIPGVELSTIIDKTEVHILGYFINWEDAGFAERMEELGRGRLRRAEEILLRLRCLGIDLSFDTVLSFASEGVIGRPHIADALVKKGLVSSYDEAFDKYIGQHAPAYVPKRLLSPAEAMELISSVGGIPVLAHPGTLRRGEIIPQLVRQGLKGIEAIHPMHTPQMSGYYKCLAEKYKIIYTGGSDYHGKGRTLDSIGEHKVPYQVVERLKASCFRL